MTSILTQLAKWRELNAKRTQGEWKYHGSDYGGEVRAVSAGYVICDDEQYYPTPVETCNQRFIAQAPSILAALITAVELCEMQRKWIAGVNHGRGCATWGGPSYNCTCGRNQALAKAEEVL